MLEILTKAKFSTGAFGTTEAMKLNLSFQESKLFQYWNDGCENKMEGFCCVFLFNMNIEIHGIKF